MSMQRSYCGGGTAAIPMIPGMLSTHYREMSKPDFRRRHILEQMSNGKALGVEAAALGEFTSKLDRIRSGQYVPTLPQPPAPLAFATSNAGVGKSANINNINNGVMSTKYRVDATQPAWITNDRLVLRFFGYFQENALEAGRETLRTRRIVLCFYLSDSALSITEPRVANSGMAQGEFMRRTVATKPDGSRFAPLDLRIGGSIKLYSRVFHLVDCDDATRMYYHEALGIEMDSPHRYPDDQSSHVDEIEAIKRKLRAKTALVAESRAEATRKFHENAHKVLRFYVSWHDPHPLYPATRRYVLHYYLSDDTIEVVEPKEPPLQPQQEQQRQRVGIHHFAVLISRRRVAKDAQSHTASSGLFGDPSTGKQLLTDRDLRCGEWISILSRRFLLEDCDPFTRDYYLEVHGITQEQCELEPTAAHTKASKWQVFQVQAQNDMRTAAVGQRGFGAAMLHRLDDRVQDTQSRKLHPPTGVDATTLGPLPPAVIDNSLDRKQLRFRAKFHGLAHTDVNFYREFTLTYFLEDDTLMVFEPRMKNSGVTGGRFLDRGRFRKYHDTTLGGTNSRENQKDRSAYSASDFYVGAIVRFEFSPNQRLELLAADEQTLSYCESHCERFPFSNAQLVLESVAHAMLRSKSADLVRRLCRSIDRDNARTLSECDFERILDKCGAREALNAQQLLTLCRKYGSSTHESDALAENNQSSNNNSYSYNSNSTHVLPQTVVYDDFCDALACYVTKLLDPSGSGHARTHRDDDGGLTKLCKVPNLRTLLRSAASDGSNSRNGAETVPSDVFLRIASFYHVELASNDLKTLLSKFSRNGALEYHKLCDSVFDVPSLAGGTSSFQPTQQPIDSPRDRSASGLRRPPTSGLRDDGNNNDDNNSEDFAFGNIDDDDLAQYCEPPTAASRPAWPSTSTHKWNIDAPRHTTVPPLQLSATRAVHGGKSSDLIGSDARVVAILRRVFGSRKYQLRKALRERDVTKSGQLDEEAFMDAVLALEPALSDDDTYVIADTYFPTNNSHVDYAQLLESAFRA